jgi:hypothetical protein
MQRVYIAAPYTLGDVGENLQRVFSAADILLGNGYIPYVPHCAHLWHLISPKSKKVWLQYDLNFLETWADCVLRLDGESEGADSEVEHARELGLPVFYSVKDFF